MSSTRDGEFFFDRKPDMFKDVNEVFLIGQGKDQYEDLSAEEQQIVKEMGFEYVNFKSGSGIYKNQYDAIAVAKKLIENKPSRNLAVISAIA